MEHANPLLIQASVYFAAAVVGVVLSHRLGLGSVAGYLLAGIRAEMPAAGRLSRPAAAGCERRS